MPVSFPYLTDTNSTAAAPATAADVSQDVGVTAMEGIDGVDAAVDPPGAEEELQFDDDADAREFIFPNLEEDVAPLGADTLARM